MKPPNRIMLTWLIKASLRDMVPCQGLAWHTDIPPPGRVDQRTKGIQATNNPLLQHVQLAVLNGKVGHKASIINVSLKAIFFKTLVQHNTDRNWTRAPPCWRHFGAGLPHGDFRYSKKCCIPQLELISLGAHLSLCLWLVTIVVEPPNSDPFLTLVEILQPRQWWLPLSIMGCLNSLNPTRKGERGLKDIKGAKNYLNIRKIKIIKCKWQLAFKNFKWHCDGTLLCLMVLIVLVIPLKPAVASLDLLKGFPQKNKKNKRIPHTIDSPTAGFSGKLRKTIFTTSWNQPFSSVWMALVRFPRGHRQRDLSTPREAGANGAHFNGIAQSRAWWRWQQCTVYVGLWGGIRWYNMVYLYTVYLNK